jgi:hypothetical protein
MPINPYVVRRAGPVLVFLVPALLLAACASNGREMARVKAPEIGAGDVANAATQPVRDLNLAGEQPGDYLAAIVKDPYGNPPEQCSGLDGEIDRLNLILGADVDAPRKADDDMLGALTIAAVRNVTSLPFRGVIREVTGAAPRERAMRQALLAGAVRRGYLKGRRMALNCPPPPPSDEPIGPTRTTRGPT